MKMTATTGLKMDDDVVDVKGILNPREIILRIRLLSSRIAHVPAHHLCCIDILLEYMYVYVFLFSDIGRPTHHMNANDACCRSR